MRNDGTFNFKQHSSQFCSACKAKSVVALHAIAALRNQGGDIYRVHLPFRAMRTTTCFSPKREACGNLLLYALG